MIHRRSGTLAILLASALALSCSSEGSSAPKLEALTPATLQLEVMTDAPCAAVRTTRIQIGDPTTVVTATPRFETNACSSGRIGVFSIDWDDASKPVGVVVTMSVGPGDCTFGPTDACVTARRSVHLALHGTTTLSITLGTDCTGVACGAETTCLHGKCVDPSVAP